jgi:F-type H+-transporting ATPase subunit delta
MTQVGSVYGEALYSLALEEGLCGRILEELTVLNQCLSQEPDYIRLLSSPNLSKQERCAVLDDSFRDKVHPYVLNFLKILTEKGYMKHFSNCCGAFEDHYNLDNGILPVTAITAVALSDEQAKKLSEKLSRVTGKQIKLLSKVDPSVLGGVRLDYDGKRLDDTVSHRMDAIRGLLKDTVL